MIFHFVLISIPLITEKKLWSSGFEFVFPCETYQIAIFKDDRAGEACNERAKNVYCFELPKLYLCINLFIQSVLMEHLLCAGTILQHTKKKTNEWSQWSV